MRDWLQQNMDSCLTVEMEKYDDKDDDAREHHDGEVESVNNVGVKFADQVCTKTASSSERRCPQHIFIFFPPPAVQTL